MYEDEILDENDDDNDEYFDEDDLAELAADYDIEEKPSDEEDDDDDLPIIQLPNLAAIQADNRAATRMIIIENTQHTVYVDAEDQYSLRQSICLSDPQSVIQMSIKSSARSINLKE